MLHEILLSLSSYHSEIWKTVTVTEAKPNGIQDYVSEPEQAMLQVLGHISRLHIQIKETADRLAVSHKSVICQAICSAINETHLAAFRKKVLDVEAAILSQDTGYVGGYGVVPLSTIVSNFHPWTRKLEWLASVIDFAKGADVGGTSSVNCMGKAMLDWLYVETQTGYRDVEALATQLLVTGQKVWLRIMASWLLCGKLPVFGSDDFFIRWNIQASSMMDQYVVEKSRVPKFISPAAAESILATGTAIIHVQSHASNGRGRSPASKQAPHLMPKHLQALESLHYPLNASVFEGVMAEIDDSVSQNALSRLLPFEDISMMLHCIHRFVLLADGEFALSLIEHATARVTERQQTQIAKPVRKVGRMDDLSIKDSELCSLLSKTWDELAVLQSDITSGDEVFNLARSTLVLRTAPTHVNVVVSTLLPNETILELQLPAESVLGLFIGPKDIRTYSTINAYLLSIRRTELQLANLWKLTAQRRCQPTPRGPPRSASRAGQQALRQRRKREGGRAKEMRQHWATTSKALFVLSELDVYFHGEVIRNSWERLNEWLHDTQARPSSSEARKSRGETSSSVKTSQISGGRQQGRQCSDPRALSQAHHLFLESLHAGLLLKDEEFLSRLKDVVAFVDHHVALFSRIQSVWEGLDLEEDDSVMDAFSNFAQDDKDIRNEMIRSRAHLEGQLAEVVQRLKDIEKDRLIDVMMDGVGNIVLGKQTFVPWMPRTMDRLIMKLDFLSGMRDRPDEDDGVMTDE